MFFKFFIKEQFNTVIELGTGNGGFTLYIAEKCNEMKADFYTFDIRQIINAASLKKLKQFGGTFFKEDTNKTDRVKNFIKDSGRILILNDGDKITSFNIYGPLLKPGDYMFIHDYYYKEPSIFDGVATWDDFENGIKKQPRNFFSFAPFVVNAAFSIEIYLKTIHKLYGKHIKGHKLSTLYKSLNEECKLIISQIAEETRHLYKIEKDKGFEYYLSELDNAFVQWRYIYEGSNERIHFLPTIYVMQVLDKTCVQIKTMNKNITT